MASSVVGCSLNSPSARPAELFQKGTPPLTPREHDSLLPAARPVATGSVGAEPWRKSLSKLWAPVAQVNRAWRTSGICGPRPRCLSRSLTCRCPMSARTPTWSAAAWAARLASGTTRRPAITQTSPGKNQLPETRPTSSKKSRTTAPCWSWSSAEADPRTPYLEAHNPSSLLGGAALTGCHCP